MINSLVSWNEAADALIKFLNFSRVKQKLKNSANLLNLGMISNEFLKKSAESRKQCEI